MTGEDIRRAHVPLDHAPSYYAASAKHDATRYPLGGSARADVCIIGGGYTGLSAAMHLAEAGRSVILVESNRVGWGASGRNGGQLHTGQRRDQDWLEAKLGLNDARHLWTLAEEAKALVRHLILRHGIDCDFRHGLITAAHKPSMVDDLKAWGDGMRKTYGYDQTRPLDKDEVAAAIGSKRYFGGLLDAGGAHLQPLSFALGIAQAAERAGARLCEGTRALRIEEAGGRKHVVTTHGTVDAADVLVAGNGYLAGIEPEIESRVVPIRNYILATEPLPHPEKIIPGWQCVADTRFVVRYWRLSGDGRMVFGGGETYSQHEPVDVAGFVRHYLLEVYPDLAHTRIDYAWGGTLAITQDRTPMIRRLRPGLYVAAGYSGQGVAIAPFAGKVVAEAIIGDTTRLDIFSRLKVAPFPGGRLLRQPLVTLAMLWFSLRDRL
ncbi:gamma-glutamylputrescine oxidase [Pseudoxanthobacter soli DSM 19599]|uniref:Gamma-glutamylputrescine oxidase n=1 Tax=Pseudoxanthobacter soli DSM 19599 TaxID=1123029 RepID=A0A1M7Z7A3_9HYPH|nr:FAD-binding oxidoreductase [Pseudoxanthobacter soli]SHO60749.1 gamma-glutamylputrescine oxidase [Pseudoxanthobacter soli DSM 19599]